MGTKDKIERIKSLNIEFNKQVEKKTVKGWLTAMQIKDEILILMTVTEAYRKDGLDQPRINA